MSTIVTARIGLEIEVPALGKFKITDFLGNGAFGEVYRAINNETGAPVAVKLLPLANFEDEQSRTALINEIKAAATISHPNIVQVLHVDEGTNPDLGPFVLMEYVSGGNLGKVLRMQRDTSTLIPLEQARKMMIDIAQGARAINEKIIHRDIKPDNILVDGDRLKIGDFGISKFVEEATRTRTFKGGQRVAYMAPEGWRGLNNTPKLDTYSVGLVFYEILCLQNPVKAIVADSSDLRSWERAHLFEQLPDVRHHRSDVPKHIAELIGKMIKKRPEDRPEWNKVLNVLDKAQVESNRSNAKIMAAVQALTEKSREVERQRLAEEERVRQKENEAQLYGAAWKELVATLGESVTDFNFEAETPIEIAYPFSASYPVYRIPHGRSIACHAFPPPKDPISLSAATLLGGGWIGIANGRSANLLLLRNPGDTYGRWKICEVNVLGGANPANLLGGFGITPETVLPMGFMRADDFYDQIRYAAGVAHVFVYHMRDDIGDFFVELIGEAIKSG